MNLFKISIAVSLLGIPFLLLLSNVLEPKEITISEINGKMLNQKIKISGEILKIENKETFSLLSIKDETGEIKALCECNLSTNQRVSITGKVTEYKNSLQINVEKIIK